MSDFCYFKKHLKIDAQEFKLAVLEGVLGSLGVLQFRSIKALYGAVIVS
jgi:hypothetical protein